jgi:oligopeptide transport system substrate-binding protein
MFREQVDTAQENASEIINRMMTSIRLGCLPCADALSTCPSLSSPFRSEHLPGGKRAVCLRHALASLTSRFPQKISSTIIDELYRFLVAAESAFLKIRSTTHLVRIIRSLNWLREQQSANRFLSHKRFVFFRLFQSKLLFDFGHRSVLSLAVSISALHRSERFDFHHILRACRDIFPDLDFVPYSCISFRHPEDKTISYYVELECQDGSRLPFSDRVILKKELQTKLEAAIERVDHHLDLPQNDEDTIRNSVLLSQQLQRVDDPAQMVVHFQGQLNNELVFLITYMRVVEADKRDTSLDLQEPTELVTFELVSSFISGFINDHLKQVHVFRVRCEKAPFFRLDHSIDFLKAREFVTHCVDEALGKVRDLNGGLICLQYALLNKVKALLSQEERRDDFLLEELFHSIRPSPMKSLLEPNHVATAFTFLLFLRAKLASKEFSGCLRQEMRGEMYLGFVYPDGLSPEEFFRTACSCGIKEHEVVLSRVDVEGRNVCLILLLSHNEKARAAFSAWVEKIVDEAKHSLLSRAILRLSLSHPTHHLDPRVGTDFFSGIVIKMLYEGLMRFDPSGMPSLAAAEHVDISPNGLRYTFTLRDSVWNNGRPVTAYDFEHAWKKVLDPSFKTFFDYLFFTIKNAQSVKRGQLPPEALGVHVVDERTLVVDLEHPAPYFLELCCLWIYSPLSREIDTLRPGWYCYAGASYICNGPFQLMSCDPKSQIQLVRNDRYWDRDRVFIDEIQILIIEDTKTSLNLFVNGELDWVGEPLNEIYLELPKQQGLKVHSQPTAGVLWFVLNANYPPFGSRKVRQAFSLALDRQSIIKKCLHGDERPSHSILPPSLSLLDPHCSLPFDLHSARQLFDEGLKDLGLDKKNITLLPMIVPDREPHITITREVARIWEEAFGISLHLNIVKRKYFFSKMEESRYAIATTSWASWYKDPQYSLDVLKEKTLQIIPSNWTSAELVELLEQAKEQRQKEDREDLLRRAEALVMNEMPIVPMYDYTYRHMKNERLDGVAISMFGTIDFRWAKIKRAPVSSVGVEDE